MLLWVVMAASAQDVLVLQPAEVVAEQPGSGPRLRLGRPRRLAWDHRVRLTITPEGEAPVTTVLSLRVTPEAEGWSLDVTELYEDGAAGATQALLAEAAARASAVRVVPDGRGGAAFSVPVPGDDPLDQALVATLWEVLRALPVSLPARGAAVGGAWTVRRAWEEPGGHGLAQEGDLSLRGVDGRLAQVQVAARADTVDGAWAGEGLDVRLHTEVQGSVWLQRGAPLWTGARLDGQTRLVIVDPDGQDVQAHRFTLEIAARPAPAGVVAP